MSAESAAGDRVRELLAELDDAAGRPARELGPLVARRAARQRTALGLVQLLVAIARAVPEAVVLATTRRR